MRKGKFRPFMPLRQSFLLFLNQKDDQENSYYPRYHGYPEDLPEISGKYVQHEKGKGRPNDSA